MLNTEHGYYAKSKLLLFCPYGGNQTQLSLSKQSHCICPGVEAEG